LHAPKIAAAATSAETAASFNFPSIQTSGLNPKTTPRASVATRIASHKTRAIQKRERLPPSAKGFLKRLEVCYRSQKFSIAN
jgi:hypothetical protein